MEKLLEYEKKYSNRKTTNSKLYVAVLVPVFAFLLCLVDSKVRSCKSANICPAGYLCCESINYTQWCCSDKEFCCSYLNGCCSAFPLPRKSFSNLFKHFHRKENHTYMVDKKLLSSTKEMYGNFTDYNPKACDNERSMLCRSKETCCLAGGSWYCCPPNTSCCENEVPCCPSSGTNDIISDVERNIKSQGSIALENPSLKKEMDMGNAIKQQFILCPDDIMICMDTNTCCLMTNCTYGCCPYEDAVCCPDLVHCCPPDTMCNLETFLCEDINGELTKRMHEISNRKYKN